MDHYGIVEGADLNGYIAIQSIVIIFVIILLVVGVRKIFNNVSSQNDTHWLSILDMLLDVGIGVLVLVFVVRMLPE